MLSCYDVQLEATKLTSSIKFSGVVLSDKYRLEWSFELERVCRALRLLASPSKSSSIFSLADDDCFLIKTMQQGEMRLLLELIPSAASVFHSAQC